MMLLEVHALLHIRLLASPSHTREKVLVFSELLKAYYVLLLLFFRNLQHHAWLLLQLRLLLFHVVVLMRLLMCDPLVTASDYDVSEHDSDAELYAKRQRRRSILVTATSTCLATLVVRQLLHLQRLAKAVVRPRLCLPVVLLFFLLLSLLAVFKSSGFASKT